MLNHARSTYTYDSENRVATEEVERSGGFAGADEVEGGGDRGVVGMGADGVPMFEKLCAHSLRRTIQCSQPVAAQPS